MRAALVLLALSCCAAVPAHVGARRVLEDRGRLCRAGNVPGDVANCSACVERARAACADAGLSCEPTDCHEPERCCF